MPGSSTVLKVFFPTDFLPILRRRHLSHHLEMLLLSQPLLNQTPFDGLKKNSHLVTLSHKLLFFNWGSKNLDVAIHKCSYNHFSNSTTGKDTCDFHLECGSRYMTLHQLPAAHPSESYKSSRGFSGLGYGYVHGPVTFTPFPNGNSPGTRHLAPWDSCKN